MKEEYRLKDFWVVMKMIGRLILFIGIFVLGDQLGGSLSYRNVFIVLLMILIVVILSISKRKRKP